jgi:hypothetical protein
MIAIHTLWRYLADGTIEITKPGQRCDWAAGGAYEQVGWAVPIGRADEPAAHDIDADRTGPG